MKTRKAARLLAVALTLALVCTACSNKGGDYPAKAVDMTVLFNAGGSADLPIRKLVDIMQRQQEGNVTIVANNRVGGGGSVGYQHVLSQVADGYSIVWNSSSISTAYYQGNLPAGQNYTQFKGVCNITVEPTAIAVNADSPYQTMDDLLAAAKENPKEITMVNAGVGSFNHITAVAFEQAADVEFNHVFSDNSNTRLLAGDVDAICTMTADLVQHVNNGTVRVLGVISPSRVAAMEDVPLVTELGIDLDLFMYRGIAVKADTDQEIVDKLEALFVEAASSEEFQTYADENGFIVHLLDNQEFDTYTEENDVMIKALMEDLDLKVQD